MDTDERDPAGGHNDDRESAVRPRLGAERSPQDEGVAALEAWEDPSPEKVHEEDVSVEETLLRVFYAMLEGVSGPIRLSKHTGLPVKSVERVINGPEIARLLVAARRDFTQSGLDRLTGSIHQNIHILEKLRENRDPRVRMEAARDLLNRTPGMAPGAKVEIGTKAYEAAVEKYLIKKDDGSSSDK